MGEAARELALSGPGVPARGQAEREASRPGKWWTSFGAALAALLAVSPAALAEEHVPSVPQIPPHSVLVETVSVDSRSEDGATTRTSLVAGQTYLVEASGVVNYGPGSADAECANFGSSSPTFKREYFPDAPHTADLVIERVGIEWVATAADVEGCNTSDHTYRTFVVPEVTKQYHFLFNDGGWRGDNSGSLTVRVFLTDEVAPAGTLVNEFSFSSATPGGANTGIGLAANTAYRLEVSGDFTFNGAGGRHDAECAYTGPAPGVRQDALDDSFATPDVLVAGGEIDWVPVKGRTGCEDAGHTYIHELIGTSGPVNLKVRDDWHGDNIGLLTVRVYNLGPAPEAPPDDGGDVPVPSVPGVQSIVSGAGSGSVFVEEMNVDSRSETGTTTRTPLVAGQIYAFEATGLVRFGNGVADAECASFDLQPTFKREYFPDAPHTADLWVDGAGREWIASTPDAQGCNTTDHKYTFFYLARTTKPVNLLFQDGGWRGDNSGSLTVRVFLTDKVPAAGTQIDHFGFDARDSDGATSTASLQANRAYRVHVSGIYTYTGSSKADPECAYLDGRLPGDRQDALDGTTATPDVLFRLQEVDWIPMRGRTGCDDRSHAYMIETSGISGPVNLRIRDTWHGDNDGLVEIKIFDLGPASSGSNTALPIDPGGSGVPEPEVPSPGAIPVSQFTVDSRSETGSDSAPLVAGQTYLIEAEGVVAYGVGDADAECANFGFLQPSFKREWFPDAPHTADLVIDGVGREWKAGTPDAEGCDTTDHRYTLFFVPSASKRFNFRFNDGGWRGDNSGSLSVRIFLVDRTAETGTVIDQFSFSAAQSEGANTGVSLSTSRSYRIEVAGTFTAANNGAVHDAECVHVAGLPGDRQDVFDAVSDTPDVLVNQQQVSWRASRGRTGCDDQTHTYTFGVSGVSGTVNLRVRDSWHGDNVGTLDVRVFDLGATSS